MKCLEVNPITMCFENMTPQDFIAIKETGRTIIVTGRIDWENPYIKLWMETCCANNDQKLIMAAVVLPQRFLLSVTGGYDGIV